MNYLEMKVDVPVKPIPSPSTIATMITDETAVGLVLVGSQNGFVRCNKVTSLTGVNIWRFLADLEMGCLVV